MPTLVFHGGRREYFRIQGENSPQNLHYPSLSKISIVPPHPHNHSLMFLFPGFSFFIWNDQPLTQHLPRTCFDSCEITPGTSQPGEKSPLKSSFPPQLLRKGDNERPRSCPTTRRMGQEAPVGSENSGQTQNCMKDTKLRKTGGNSQFLHVHNPSHQRWSSPFSTIQQGIVRDHKNPEKLPAAAAAMDEQSPNNLFWGGFNYASWERNTERGRNIPKPWEDVGFGQ